VRGQDYDDFIEEFVVAVDERWPHVMLQWEDFAKSNATRLLDRYRDRLCTFNDDIQGTAAVATGTLLAAVEVTGVPLKDQRVAILGAGSAGSGIAALIRAAMVDAGLEPTEAARRFYLVDKDGLLLEGMSDIAPFQAPFVQPRSILSSWTVGRADRVSLLDVINNAKPTALIGVSGQAGAFNESVVRAIAKHNGRPIIFPLSNPVSHAEAAPAEIERWSEGRAIIGAGSAHHRHDVHGGGQGARRAVAGAQGPHRQPVAAGHRIARGRDRDRGSGRPPGLCRRPYFGCRRRGHRGGSARQDVDAALSHLSARRHQRLASPTWRQPIWRRRP